MQKKIKQLLFNPLFLLGIILLLAAFARLYRIDVLMRFLWDESRDMLAIRNIIVNKDITFFGPFNDIAGRKDFFGVSHYYLMLPALLVANFNPVGPAIFTALLGVLAVGLTYFWVSQWEKKSTALAVSAIMAVSPLVVRFNQWPWNPNTIGFFAVLYLIALQKYQKKSAHVWIFIAGFLLGILFQLHYFTIALGAGLFPIFYLKKRIDWKILFVFILAFTIPNLTFVIFDITHQGFYRTILFESFLGGGNQKLVSFSFVNLFTNPLLYLFDVTHKFLNLGFLGFVLLGSWIVYAYKKLHDFYKKGTNIQEVQLILSWIIFLCIPIFFSSLADDYHSGGLWISFALAIVYICKKLTKKYWHVVIVTLVLLLFFSNNFNRQPTSDENMPHLQVVSNVITQDVKENGYTNSNIASFVDADTRAVRFRYFIAKNELEILGVDDYLRTDVLYAVTKQPWEDVKNQPAWELSNFREASATAIWEDSEWRVYRVER